MTGTEYERAKFWGRISEQTPVIVVAFRFKGSDHWWAEFFVDKPYNNSKEQQAADWRRVFGEFCDLA
jgi:hypothetical protein